MVDLWPDQFGTLVLPPPILLLKQQASLLSKKTGGRIVAEVYPEVHKQDFSYSFMLEAPFLGDYQYLLFRVSHPVELYPLVIHADVTEESIRCDTPEQFQAALQRIFSSPETIKVIQAMLAQTDAVRS